eukprot:TRINITY_DN373_c0_g2_i1.p2 TRINITY_DN373_c0_g2~~TRINITY_DN373_c0_g2_i1.p2  ORF type:complete len:164 (-),score=49.08 TRINITY_DN373_c0_g2_i1:730-1221(-)
MINCTIFDNRTNNDQFPISESIYYINEQLFSVDCQSFNISKQLALPSNCPHPLELFESYDPICNVRCPGLGLISENHIDNILTIRFYLSLSSLIIDFLLIITIISIPKKRKFPANIILFALFADFLWVFTWVVCGIIGYKEILCSDDSTLSTQYDNALCGVEG